MDKPIKTIDALEYWINVVPLAVELSTRSDDYGLGDKAKAMLNDLARRSTQNCRTLLRSIEHDEPGGLRERMTIMLVNHGNEAKRAEWDSIPEGVRFMLETGNDCGHLADDYSLHS